MLYVRPIEGYLTRQTNMLLSMDPYCIIMFAGKEYKTSPHFSGGSRPKWSETFSFDVNSLDKIKVEAWSRAVISNDSIIGKGELDLRKFRLMPGTALQEYVELFYEGKPAGKILLQLAFTTQVVKKKQIFDQKVRTSMPQLPSMKQMKGIEKQKSKQKEKAQTDSNVSDGFLFSFAKPPQNTKQPPQKPKQQIKQQSQQPQQYQQHQQKNLQQQINKNEQKVLPQQSSSLQQIPSQLQQQTHQITQQNLQKNIPPSNNPQTLQTQMMQQQNLKYNHQQQQQQQQQQNPMAKQPNYMPGLPHKQLGVQRPTSPLLNGAKFNQITQKYNNFPNKQPSLLQQQPSYPPLVNQQKHLNPPKERQNKQMSASNPTQRVGIGKTPPKSILSPAKKRDKSNKKVTFQC